METARIKEIAAIKALVEMNGYFADYFKNDLDTMAENIKNDFPIECGTSFNNAAEMETQKNKNLKKRHEENMYSLYETMLCVASETGNERLYERVNQEIGLNNLIKMKRVLGLDLTCKEIDYMVSQLK